MKGKVYFILALTAVATTIYAEKDNNKEVEIDLNSNRLVSKDGVNVRYGELKMKAFEVKVDKSKNRAYIPGEFYIEADEPTGNLKMDLENGEVALDGTEGKFGKSLGYLEVGQVTGAEKPNDKIYFGGESTEYKNGKTYLKNAWFTTDPKIRTTRDPLNTGYHLKSDEIIVEPDKQVTFLNSDLYIGDKDIIPFSLPWYRFNIRQGSKVPLFPQWGTKDEYGWYISTGVLYGDKDSRFKGGFAPKFGDQIGFMIGRMENWYDLGKYGKGQLNITDWLIDKKADKDDVERNFDRWNFDYNHKYSGEYGKLNINYRNATYNMIPSMDDAIDKYFHGKGNKERKGNSWKYIDGVPDKGGNLGFYQLDSDLKNLGENKDITLKAKLNLVSDKEAYGVIVADQLDDMDYKATADYDLMSEVVLNKENDRYSIGGYYKYLYDMDPGSTKDDLQSRAEEFGFHIKDKKYKVALSYDDKTGDKYRRLNSWERDPNFSKLNNNGPYGIEFDYTPWTVAQYTKYDSQNAKATFGEYDFIGDWKVKTGYEYNHFEHELSLQNDPFRNKALLDGKLGKTTNLRDVEYNRYENIIYNKTTENRAFVDFIYGNTKFTLAGGDTKEEIWDREGIYDKEAWSDGSYKIYLNESTFYEGGIAQDNIKLGPLGNLSLYGNIRVDQYDKGYTTKEISTDDRSTRYRAGLTHNINLFDNTTNKNRTIDLALDNTFTYMYQDYSYDGGDNQMNKDLRLRHKENIQAFGDTVEFEVGNTKTIYTVDYKEIKRASTDKKKGEILNQKLDFLINDENSLGLEYSLDKRYTDKNQKDENHNDLTLKNYGINYTYGNNYFYYKNRNIDSSIWEIENVADAKEKIKEHVYGYTYSFGDDKLNLEYISGKDRRIEENKEVINSKNNSYSVSYFMGGDVEQKYTASYEDYESKGAWNSNLSKYNSDVVYLGYSYKDKRFTDEELVSYAASEYKKSPDQLTQYEIDRIRQVLQDRENSRARTFNLNRIIEDKSTYFGDYKRGFQTSIMMQRNKKRYEQTGDYLKSLEEMEGRLFYSYNRIGVGYIYNQKYNWKGEKWGATEKEHEFSLHAKIGKPSEGWRTKAYVKFYDHISGEKDDGGTFDGFGIELGKEFGYYEWAVAYERDYSYRTKDYEWSAALQFKLLTFPDNNIFGLGATTDINHKTSPDTYLFDGIKIDDID